MIDAVLAQAIGEIGENLEIDAVTFFEEIIGMDLAFGM